MKTLEIKSELYRKIEALNARQLNEIYGLFQNYVNANDDTEEWNRLPRLQQDKIVAGIRQANANNLKSASEVTARLRKKYASNG